jgi:hypothetical protein
MPGTDTARMIDMIMQFILKILTGLDDATLTCLTRLVELTGQSSRGTNLEIVNDPVGIPTGRYAVVRATIPAGGSEFPAFRGTFILRDDLGVPVPWFGGADGADDDGGDWAWWASSDLTDVQVVYEGQPW